MMEHTTDIGRRCTDLLAMLNSEQGWNLSAAEQRKYVTALGCHLPPTANDLTIRKMLTTYHDDHGLVQALGNSDHVRHQEAWNDWIGRVMAILRHTGLNWSNDMIADEEDLAQIALLELVHSLPSYHYASRFSTWAYRVVVQAVQRHFRDCRAQKRAVRPASIHHLAEGEEPPASSTHPDEYADAIVLASLVQTILSEYDDSRVARIFYLWASADLRVEEIGQRLQLSSSRVRHLLKQARSCLQHHPAIRDWQNNADFVNMVGASR